MRQPRPLRLALLLLLATSQIAASSTAASDRSSPAGPDDRGFLTGPDDRDPDVVAIEYLRRDAATYGLTEEDLAEVEVRSSYVSGHTGATHVNLNQRYEGLEIFGADTTVTLTADGSVAHVGGAGVSGLRPAPDAARRADTGPLDAVGAVEAAADELDLDEPEDLEELASTRTTPDADDVTVLTDGGISEEPIEARLGWHAADDGLRLAWQVVIDDVTDVHLWNATVDARSGELLDLDDWTSVDDLDDLAGRLMRPDAQRSAAVDRLGLPSGRSDQPPGPNATVFESVNPVRDGSSYRVFPQESPDDSASVLSVEPADGTASPFGWHDVTGTAGPDYTITRGNNVHAYTDRDATNVPDPGSEPDGGPELTFDHELAVDEHPQFSVEASLTNLFWWCNISHDLFYLYGFDEPSGNFQVDNYGRGGVGGDDVRCEGMDGVGQNNANFSTPAADGGRPRMQTMIEFGTGMPSAVTVDAGPVAGTYVAQYARFTPPATTAGMDGSLVLVDDGVGAPTDGCEPFTLAEEGTIAVLDTSETCSNDAQVRNAEAAGAIAVVVIDTQASPRLMSGSMVDPVQIPAIRIGAADGAVLRDALAEGTLRGSVHRNTERAPMRVGDFDTATIIHEYGHGVSLRLTGGPGINCLTGHEQAGEGWSDFFALVALIDLDLDDPEAARGIYPYVVFQEPREGAGLRPRPYSRDMTVQPFTYDSITTNGWLNGGSLSAPHGIGHGFAALTWDLTWDLIEKHGFNPNLYDDWSTGGNNLMLQLVVDGLKIQGCDPGLLDVRDGILVADQLLTDGENQCTLWAGFSRRGFGYSAEQGTTDRNDNREAFDTHPDCERPFLSPRSVAFRAGSTVPLRFAVDDLGGEVLASNAPFARQVDCVTGEVPSVVQGQITPRMPPTPTTFTGNAGRVGQAYHYNLRTDRDWAGTCQEIVVTRTDGIQYRTMLELS